MALSVSGNADSINPGWAAPRPGGASAGASSPSSNRGATGSALSPSSTASSGAAPAPQVKGLRIPARRTGSTASLLQALSALPFLRLVQDGTDPNTLLALNVESRDIQKNPYLFSIAYFRPDAIDMLYTLLPNASPKTRRLDMVQYTLNLLTLTAGQYQLDLPYLYQLVESTLADLHEYASADYNQLFSTYDSLQSQAAAMTKKVKELNDANVALAKDNYDLKGRLDELTLRLQSVERYSDSVLAVKIQEWLSEHNGEINLSDFCRVHNVTEARVEQVLNQLVSEGYLENRK